MSSSAPDYDVCMSFAGEDRLYVERVVECLRAAGVRVFYDRDEQVELWGKDLFQHLSDVYRERARYCIIFASAAYAAKHWTRHELKSAQARAFRESREYILPVRIDNTELPGLLETIGYIEAAGRSADELARLIIAKVRGAESRPPEQLLAATIQPSAHESAASATPPPPQRPILARYPLVDAIRKRVSEPLDACERYMDIVEHLARAGRWRFGIGVAYPSELIAADDTLSHALRRFARDLRSAADEIDNVTEHDVKTLGMLGAFGPLAEVRQVLLAAAVATEHLRDFRDEMRSNENRATLRASRVYQSAVSALNQIVEEIENAEAKWEMGAAFIELAGKAKRLKNS